MTRIHSSSCHVFRWEKINTSLWQKKNLISNWMKNVSDVKCIRLIGVRRMASSFFTDNKNFLYAITSSVSLLYGRATKVLFLNRRVHHVNASPFSLIKLLVVKSNTWLVLFQRRGAAKSTRGRALFFGLSVGKLAQRRRWQQRRSASNQPQQTFIPVFGNKAAAAVVISRAPFALVST